MKATISCTFGVQVGLPPKEKSAGLGDLLGFLAWTPGGAREPRMAKAGGSEARGYTGIYIYIGIHIYIYCYIGISRNIEDI